MITSKSSRLNSQGFFRFTRRHRRLILFVAPLAIALVLTLAFGLVGRTVTAQKGARDAAEAALKGKADFLLRETYRAARTIKQQPTTTTEAESNLRVEDEIHSLSKIIDIKSQRTGSIRVSVAVRLASGDDSELRAAGFSIGSKINNIVTIETDANRLADLASLASVRKISASTFQHKLNDQARQAVSIDNASGQRVVSQTGRGVVVGIVDTGIDFRHGDFIVSGSSPPRTRIKHLWDISDHRDDFVLPGASSPRGHAYTEADINAALANPSNPNLVLEKDIDGHGTHVAGTAAGNGNAGTSPGTFAGMAPEADLVVVKATRADDGSFGSTDIINALAFVQQKAVELNEPFVINLSLGGHLGPHDGTDPEERVIDNIVNSGTGRAVCVAAGNDQQTGIHAEGNLGNGQDRTIDLESPFFDTPQFMILYYSNNDRISISITTPDGQTALNGVSYDPAGNPVSNQFVDVFNTKDDKSWNEFGFPDTDPANDQSVILIAFKDTAIFQDTSGNPLTSWNVKLHGDNITSGGHFESWIGQGFLVPGSNFSHLVTSPGNARGAITVGAFVTRPSPGNSTLGNITNYSSPGPTADERQKPEIVAPGHVLASSRSADVNPADVPAFNGDSARAAFTGTSMATAVVAGSIATLLQGAPNLSSDQIKFFITDSADLGFSGQSGWNSLYGFGKLNVVSLFSEAIGNPGDTFTISGFVSNGFPGITITLSGSKNDSLITSSGGQFSFSNLPRGGDYTVSANALFFHLSPPVTVHNLVRNQTIPTFSAAAGLGLVAGNVNDANGHNLAGVTVTLSKPGLAETASRVTTSGGTNGNYFFTGIAQLDTYMITPSLNGFTFTPVSRTFQGEINLNVDFVAVPANPIEDSRTFVRQHYLDFLNREPDAAGWQFWIDNIDSCGGNAQCREVKRIDTSAAYFLSIEFQQTGYLVHRFYRASFGRRPLFSEFLTDTQAIGNGVVVNAPGWEQLLEDNIESFRDSWVTRPAFTSIYNGLSNGEYVDTLIANTGVTFTPTDRNAFIDVLNNNAMTRAQILRLIAEDQAFFNAEYNAAFVEMQYFGYLRRNPQDPPNTDLSGFNFWLNKLNEFGGDFRRAEMVKAFLISGEYRQRFGPQ
jgi:subtilisin family serine protease